MFVAILAAPFSSLHKTSKALSQRRCDGERSSRAAVPASTESQQAGDHVRQATIEASQGTQGQILSLQQGGLTGLLQQSAHQTRNR